MQYATSEDLQNYLAVEAEDLPKDVDRLLERASDFIDYLTVYKINTDNESHIDAARKAVCAQVEYWIENEDESITDNSIQSFSLASFSVTYDKSSPSSSSLSPLVSPRASQYLFKAGLLYRGIRMR